MVDEEKTQERSCKLAEGEDVSVLPPFLCEKKFGTPILYGGFVKINPEDISDEFVPLAEVFKKGE